jgi:hypothetical protein
MRSIAILVRGFLMLVLFASAAAHGEDPEVRDANLQATDEGLVLNADFSFDLSPRLADIVANGVPLYFVVEFDLTRPRWYWIDEKTASRRLQLRLSYHALSRQYRLSSGLLQQNFQTLGEALNVLKRVRHWVVVERTVALSESDYEVAVRLRLDNTMLPKPFQLSALTSRELQLETPWKRFMLRALQHAPAPVESREQKAAEDK